MEKQAERSKGEKGSFERDSSPLTNLVRFRINDPYTKSFMHARTDEYLLGTKGSQLPSYVPCHAHYRLYNPSCDVTLFNPFITEPLRTLSLSLFSPLAIHRAVLTLARLNVKTEKQDQECARVYNLGIRKERDEYCRIRAESQRISIGALSRNRGWGEWAKFGRKIRDFEAK